MTKAYILLGSNLNDPYLQLKTAQTHLQAKAGEIVRSSSIYNTAAWGVKDQPSFLNQVILLDTPLEAINLLECLLEIEKEMGRHRTTKWGSRIIDLDILYYGKEIVTQAFLKIPHQELANRKFVLVPLCEIAHDFVHPILNVSNQYLLEHCQDELAVNKAEIPF